MSLLIHNNKSYTFVEDGNCLYVTFLDTGNCAPLVFDVPHIEEFRILSIQIHRDWLYVKTNRCVFSIDPKTHKHGPINFGIDGEVDLSSESAVIDEIFFHENLVCLSREWKPLRIVNLDTSTVVATIGRPIPNMIKSKWLDSDYGCVCMSADGVFASCRGRVFFAPCPSPNTFDDSMVFAELSIKHFTMDPKVVFFYGGTNVILKSSDNFIVSFNYRTNTVNYTHTLPVTPAELQSSGVYDNDIYVSALGHDEEYLYLASHSSASDGDKQRPLEIIKLSDGFVKKRVCFHSARIRSIAVTNKSVTTAAEDGSVVTFNPRGRLSDHQDYSYCDQVTLVSDGETTYIFRREKYFKPWKFVDKIT